MQTITAINPWTKETTELRKSDVMRNPIDAYPLDQNISDQVTGDYATDWEWLCAYAALTTPEHMGAVILGS